MVAEVAVVAVDKENMMTNIKATNMIDTSPNNSRFWPAFRTLALASLLSAPMLGMSAEQKTFANPEEAVGALIETCQTDDEAALIAIFGEKHKRLVVSPDRAENMVVRTRACNALKAFFALEEVGADRRILLMGEQAWPMPVPLVREKNGWRFATELAEEEILNRRIGANERNAIDVLRAYLDAQRQYASSDRNGDEVLEYAQKLGSTPGKHDGLYWPADTAKGEEASPFGPLIAESEAYFKGHKTGDSFRGYHFRILTRQGKNAPGGAYSYIINGRMIAGFALFAYPAEYGTDGVMSFIVSNSGKLYEKDLGPKTQEAARRIKEFNPDASWRKLADPS